MFYVFKMLKYDEQGNTAKIVILSFNIYSSISEQKNNDNVIVFIIIIFNRTFNKTKLFLGQNTDLVIQLVFYKIIIIY
jgi:hypothetical protein